MIDRRDVVLLGSTGSIGTQAIDVIDRNPERFRVVALAAEGGRPGLLAEQAVGSVPAPWPSHARRRVPAVRSALERAGAAAVRLLSGPGRRPRGGAASGPTSCSTA